jgi:DNA-binding transcriptional LysR family regulator
MARRLAQRPALPAWSDLKLFLDVARAGSFTKASRLLGIEQSTVSRRIAALEAELGAPLFERLRRGSALTTLGEKLQRHAEAMESQLLALVDEASGHDREIEGAVRLALTESIATHAVIPRVLPALYQRYPKLSLQLFTSYEVSEMGHRHAEIALRFFRPRSGDLVAERIVLMPTALVAHKRYRRTPLDELPLVSVHLEHMQVLEDEYLRQHFYQAPRLVTGSYVAQIAAVRAGLGAALLARSVQQSDAQLIEVGQRLPPGPVLELWLVAPRSLRHVPRVAAVWSALEAGLSFLNEGKARRAPVFR